MIYRRFYYELCSIKSNLNYTGHKVVKVEYGISELNSFIVQDCTDSITEPGEFSVVGEAYLMYLGSLDNEVTFNLNGQCLNCIYFYSENKTKTLGEVALCEVPINDIDGRMRCNCPYFCEASPKITLWECSENSFQDTISKLMVYFNNKTSTIVSERSTLCKKEYLGMLNKDTFEKIITFNKAKKIIFADKKSTICMLQKIHQQDLVPPVFISAEQLTYDAYVYLVATGYDCCMLSDDAKWGVFMLDRCVYIISEQSVDTDLV